MGRISPRYNPLTETRRPIHVVATGYLRWLGIVGSVVVAALGYGVLTLTQGDAVAGLLGTIPGVVQAVATTLTAFGIVRKAEPLTTPLSSPRTATGTPLRPAGDPAPPVPSAASARARGRWARDDSWWDRSGYSVGRGPVTYNAAYVTDDDQDRDDRGDRDGDCEDDAGGAVLEDGRGGHTGDLYPAYHGDRAAAVHADTEDRAGDRVFDQDTALPLTHSPTSHATSHSPVSDPGRHTPSDTHTAPGSGGSGHHSSDDGGGYGGGYDSGGSYGSFDGGGSGDGGCS